MLRDSLRRVLIVRAEKRRKDFEGAVNCDFDVTKKMLTSKTLRVTFAMPCMPCLRALCLRRRSVCTLARLTVLFVPFVARVMRTRATSFGVARSGTSLESQMVLLNLLGSTGHRSRSYVGFMSRELRRLCTHVG